MISKLTGKLATLDGAFVDIETSGGVTYRCQVPVSVSSTLRHQGIEVGHQPDISLHTHRVMRENYDQLFGFMFSIDRDLFANLVEKVDRVGPKVALTILSGTSTPALIASIGSRSEEALNGRPGIGPKTAKFIVEALGEIYEDQANEAFAGVKLVRPSQIELDAIAALVALGYQKAKAAEAVTAALKGPRTKIGEVTVEWLVRAALKK